MYRSRDFFMKKIFDLKGDKLGMVKDLFINYNIGKVEGFKISNYSFMNKKNYISVDDIVDINNQIIVKKAKKGDGLSLSDIKNMDVIDTEGNLKGTVEDVLIDIKTYEIKALVVYSGMIDKFIKGKEIILINRTILGEDYILFMENKSISMVNIPNIKNNAYEIN